MEPQGAAASSHFGSCHCTTLDADLHCSVPQSAALAEQNKAAFSPGLFPQRLAPAGCASSAGGGGPAGRGRRDVNRGPGTTAEGGGAQGERTSPPSPSQAGSRNVPEVNASPPAPRSAAQPPTSPRLRCSPWARAPPSPCLAQRAPTRAVGRLEPRCPLLGAQGAALSRPCSRSDSSRFPDGALKPGMLDFLFCFPSAILYQNFLSHKKYFLRFLAWAPHSENGGKFGRLFIWI